MVLHDPQDFGGLEEYAVTLAINLQQQGQQVSVLSTTWAPSSNQYIYRLIQGGVNYIQPPKYLSYPASHWPTKQKILNAILLLASPSIFFLSIGVLLIRRNNWRQAWMNSRNWLGGWLQYYFIAPNRYKFLTVMLLSWWRWSWRPDLFHIHGYTSSLLFAIEWAHKKNIPVVYEEHQTPDAQFDWWDDFQYSINKATTVVAVSDKSAEGLRNICKVTRPIVVCGPLVPDPLGSGWHGKDSLSSHNRSIQVTTVARLVEAKGLVYLLETIARVRFYHPNVNFRVYGDGPLLQDLLSRAIDLGLDGDKIFVGSFKDRDELSRIMAETDIFVMPSILEGQPLSLVEAMAYGCPIVTTSVGGIPELIQDGVNGLLCHPHDPECLAEKVRLLVENPSMREKLGRASRQSYETGPFQPASASDRFISIYQATLDGRDPATNRKAVD